MTSSTFERIEELRRQQCIVCRHDGGVSAAALLDYVVDAGLFEDLQCCRRVSRKQYQLSFGSPDSGKLLIERGREALIDSSSVFFEFFGEDVTFVRVSGLPHELHDDLLKDNVKSFGTVLSVALGTIVCKGQRTVSDGTRLLRIVMRRAIPEFLCIEGYQAVFSYPGVVRLCRNCLGEGHEAKSCNRVVCYRCGGDHKAKVCGQNVSKPAAVEATAVDPNGSSAVQTPEVVAPRPGNPTPSTSGKTSEGSRQAVVKSTPPRTAVTSDVRASVGAQTVTREEFHPSTGANSNKRSGGGGRSRSNSPAPPAKKSAYADLAVELNETDDMASLLHGKLRKPVLNLFRKLERASYSVYNEPSQEKRSRDRLMFLEKAAILLLEGKMDANELQRQFNAI